jgi:holo-[acyl-carrier protein] synthase
MILGIGVDIIEIGRLKNAVERWGEDFLNHVFVPEEISWAKSHKFPFPHYAGRFAAKEAIFKALGNKQVGWKDLIIRNDTDGKPYCTCHKTCHQILLTISHSKEYAVAQAIVTA